MTLWLVICMLSLPLPSQAEWKTMMRSAHYTTNTMVVNVNSTIVNTSFTASNNMNCFYRCTRLSGIKSLYYSPVESTCYCNNVEDNTAITGASGIQYSPLRYKLTTQIEKGEQRFKLPEGNLYMTCSEIYQDGYRSSGSYFQTHYGTSTEFYCNMDYVDWYVFQRRFDGSVDFYRNWTEYVNGFGSPSGEFWLGLEHLHTITDKRVCELLIYLDAGSANTIQTSGYARYTSFSIGDADSNYTLHATGFSGTVGDALEVHNNLMFSTYDADNDASVSNCAYRFRGGWWYESCHSANLNGPYLSGDHASFGDGMNWRVPWGYHFSLLRTEMMYKCN